MIQYSVAVCSRSPEKAGNLSPALSKVNCKISSYELNCVEPMQFKSI